MTEQKKLVHFLPDATPPSESTGVCENCLQAVILLKDFPKPIYVTAKHQDGWQSLYLLVEPVMYREGLVNIRFLTTSYESKIKTAAKSWPFFLSCLAHQGNLLQILANPKLNPWDSFNSYIFSKSLEGRALDDLVAGTFKDSKEVVAKIQEAEAELAAQTAARLERNRIRAERQAAEEKARKEAEPERRRARQEIDKLRHQIEAKKQEIEALEQSIQAIIDDKLASMWCKTCRQVSGGGCDFCGDDIEFYKCHINNKEQLFCCQSCAENGIIDTDEKAWIYSRDGDGVGCVCNWEEE
jgi:hypothetical protein